MFRILFFLAVCSLAFYGVYSAIVPNSLQKSEYSSLSFDSYLNQALARNILPQEKYTVVFLKEDFVDISSATTYTDKLYQEDWSSWNAPTFLGDSPEDFFSPRWNFWTPSIQSQGAGYKSKCSAWLIFDPCLVIGDPIPANGGMYFGSDTI